MADQSDPSDLGNVLVVGGCGFLGFHLVSQLLLEKNRSTIHVVSRNPSKNLQDGVKYHQADIADSNSIAKVLEEIKPKVIFHTASPLSSNMEVKATEFTNTNITGTQNLLAEAHKVASVRAFVLSSTVSVASGSPHNNIDETAPLWKPGPGCEASPYELSKLEAEKAVLGADAPGFGTTSMRLCLVYGERDNQFVPGMLEAVYQKRTNVQLGDNTNRIDTVSATNASAAHILAAKALLDPSRAKGKVGGEPFIITDGNPQPFWDIARIIFRAAGDTTKPEDIKVIPAWVAMTMATILEGTFWILTLGSKRPKSLNRLVVIHTVRNYTYSIDKARSTLGYNPTPDLEAGIKRAVTFELAKQTRKD